MYLAPLNYDRYFKKVFSDLEISKQFLSDVLDVEIESIEQLPPIHNITDQAVYVEFDFRCKINGKYVIVDMQQWYKPDVVKRFYVYHCANTVLQLEELLRKEAQYVPENSTEKRKVRSYSYHTIEPVITLIWMVDDNLHFADDFVTYSTFPKISIDSWLDESLWQPEALPALQQRRADIMKVLQNDYKSLDFLQTNQMTYFFQKNIIKNKKMAKYARWFEFAEKTKNKENKQEDFEEYLEDKVFSEVIRRISKEVLLDDDYGYIRTQEERKEEHERYERELKVVLRPEVRMEVREELREELIEEVKAEVKEEVKAEVKEEVKAEVKEEVKAEVWHEVAKQLLQNGESIEKVAQITGLSVRTLQEFYPKA